MTLHVLFDSLKIFAFSETAKHICKLENSTDNLINAYHSLNHLPGVQSNNGSIHLQLYAFAKNDLHILFSEKEDVKPENTDIQIGKKFGIDLF